MSFGWIDPTQFSIYSLLLMDEYIVSSMAKNKKLEFRQSLGMVLRHHPAILWYLQHKAPESAEAFEQLMAACAYEGELPEIETAENRVIDELDWAIVYVYPEEMEQLGYITYWDESRLLSMTDFNDKMVLDVGAGTGRLTFAAAKAAKLVYAVEPVERLRRFMREKAKRHDFSNVYVVDGTIEQIPFCDDTFDVTMSGYTMGDDYAAEYRALERVTKPGGFIIDCPGEEARMKELSDEMIGLGFHYEYYKSKTGGNSFRYIKQLPL